MTRRDFNLAAMAALQLLNRKAQAASDTSVLLEGSDVRRVGVRVNGAYSDHDIEHIDVLSGNLNLSIPLVHAVSRKVSVDFTLSYNSQLWRFDSGAVQSFGVDTGYGFGWRLQPGAVLPVLSGNSNLSGYLYIDSSGAEYPMVKTDGLWVTKQGMHVTFDPSSARLYLNNGVSWLMGCVSGRSEADAGTLYPTLIEDSNGNQILIQYLPAMGQSQPNTSARIHSIEDARAVDTPSGRQTYLFVYGADGIPRLLSIVARISTPENYSFSYTTPHALQSPFEAVRDGQGRDAEVIRRRISPASSLVQFLESFTPSSQSAQIFGYSQARTGELVSMETPYGAHLRWDYATATFANGSAVRTVTHRTIAVSPSEPPKRYVFSHPPGYTSGVVAPATSLSLEGGTRQQVWYFDSTPGSTTLGLMVADEDRSLATGLALRRRDYGWGQSTDGNVYKATTITTLDAGTENETRSKSETVIDEFGNITEMRQYEYGNLSKPARVTRNSYETNAAYTSRYLRQLLLSTTVTADAGPREIIRNVYDSTPLTVRTGLREHDSQAYNASFLHRGNVTESVISGRYSMMSYDITGLLARIQDAVNSSIALEPAESTNNALPGVFTPNGNSQLGHSIAYDAALRPILVRKLNGAVRTLGYDDQGRLATVTSADGAVTTYSYGVKPPTVTTTKAGAWLRKSLDGLGRVTKIERGYGNDAVYIAKREYDLEHPDKLSRTSGWHANGTDPEWKAFTYDELGRVTRLGLRGNSGVVRFKYAGNTKTRTGATGREKTLAYNATQTLQQVIQPHPSQVGERLRTSYQYNEIDQLVTVTIPRRGATQQRKFQYDAHGRLIQKQHVETGAVDYVYNPDGSKRSKTDVLGRQTVYNYDAYKRLVSVSRYPEAGQLDPTQDVTYHYDGNPFDAGYSQNALGRLAAVRWGSIAGPGGRFTEMYTYAASGKITGKRIVVERNEGSASLELVYSHDSNGRLIGVTYPGSLGQVTYTYDLLGRVVGLVAHQPQQMDIVKDVHYTCNGQIAAIKTLIPGTDEYYAESRTYNVRSQLTRLQAGPENPGNSNRWMPTVDLRYEYDAARNDGKVTKVTDAIAGETVRYSYDSLGRVVGAETVGDGWGMRFGYDDFGNLTTQQVTKGRATTLEVLHDLRTNRVVAPSIVYDASGNLVRAGSLALRYDMENRLIEAGMMEQYAYDPNNLRIWAKKADGQEELTLYGLGSQSLATFKIVTAKESLSLEPLASSLYFNGKLVQSNGAVLVTDPVNSVRARVGAANGQEARTFAYFPFGQEREVLRSMAESQGGPSVDVEKFGSYLRSGATSLDYAKQRYYYPTLARFLTTDPADGSANPTDPESWNRYAFAKNDPVNYYDSNGSSASGSSYTSTTTTTSSTTSATSHSSTTTTTFKVYDDKGKYQYTKYTKHTWKEMVWWDNLIGHIKQWIQSKTDGRRFKDGTIDKDKTPNHNAIIGVRG